MNKYKSFTFLEVLITLTILSIISLLVVGLLKPQETFKVARDAKRVLTLNQIEKTLILYLKENPRLNLGSSTIIYISLPDNSASCTSWKDKLPPLPSGYEYRCSANPQNIDGTGWIPIDFTKSSITNISSLPLDPINNPPYYFTYVADNNKKSFEITAYLESDKNKGENSVSANDNGTNINLYEAGNDKKLNPSDYEIARTGGAALPGGSLLWYATSGNCTAYSVALDSTGIYVVGCDSTLGSSNLRWRIEKRNLNDGSLIWSVTSNPSSGEDVAYSVAVDSTGIYVVGYDYAPGNAQWRIEKRNLNDGSLIWSVTSNPSSGSDIARSVAVDSTGIYVVGYDQIPGNWQWRIEKRNKDNGNLIWVATSNPSNGWEAAVSIAVDSGAVYIGGYEYNPSSGNIGWRIEKRNKDNGNLIWVATSILNYEGGAPFGIWLDEEYLYIAGYDTEANNSQWRIEKRNKNNGNLIWVVNSNPTTQEGVDEYYDVAYSIVGSDNSLYIVGHDRSSDISSSKQWRIEKRSKDNGNLIWVINSNPSSYHDEAYSAAVDNTGIYVVGYDEAGWRIEKRVK